MFSETSFFHKLTQRPAKPQFRHQDHLLSSKAMNPGEGVMAPEAPTLCVVYETQVWAVFSASKDLHKHGWEQ